MTFRQQSAIFILFLLFQSGVTFAVQNYDLKELTPTIQQAIEGRKARFSQLQQLKRAGSIGEGNKGYVEVLGTSSGADQIVAAENQDRQTIYQAIVSQNQLGPEGPAEIQRIFAEVQRGKAQAGDLTQLPTGEWIKKS